MESTLGAHILPSNITPQYKKLVVRGAMAACRVRAGYTEESEAFCNSRLKKMLKSRKETPQLLGCIRWAKSHVKRDEKEIKVPKYINSTGL